MNFAYHDLELINEGSEISLMHMADALISPAVGGALWVAAAGLTAASARRVRTALDERVVPLMGVLGAFVFAAQMINFSIPLTGSSGHLGGGLLLAILLGPHAAFLALASILTVQALFFADGGLLALGCNLVNLGFIPCFVAYPLIYRTILKCGMRNAKRGVRNKELQIADCRLQIADEDVRGPRKIEPRSTMSLPAEATYSPRSTVAAVVAAIVALQLGAFGVVLETVASGRSELPLRSFALVMQPIHLAIGVVEGLVTAAVIGFVRQVRPEGLVLSTAPAAAATPAAPSRLRPVLAGFALAALVTAGVVSWFASSRPDGLEWSVARTAGSAELPPSPGALHADLAGLQSRAALFPDYDFKSGEPHSAAPAHAAQPAQASVVNVGASVSGLVGAALTLGFIAAGGFALRRRKPKY